MHQIQIVFNKAYTFVYSLVIGLKIPTTGTLQQAVVRPSCEYSKKTRFRAFFCLRLMGKKKKNLRCVFHVFLKEMRNLDLMSTDNGLEW